MKKGEAAVIHGFEDFCGVYNNNLDIFAKQVNKAGRRGKLALVFCAVTFLYAAWSEKLSIMADNAQKEQIATLEQRLEELEKKKGE